MSSKALRNKTISRVYHFEHFAVKKIFFFVQGLKITIGQKFIDALVNSNASMREIFIHQAHKEFN